MRVDGRGKGIRYWQRGDSLSLEGGSLDRGSKFLWGSREERNIVTELRVSRKKKPYRSLED